MNIQKHYGQLKGWRITAVDFQEDEYGESFPILTLKKRGFRDLKIDVLRDEEGNGAGFLSLYHEKRETENA